MIQKERKNALCRDKTSGWEKLNTEEKEKIFKFSDEYMNFLNQAKTEKEVVQIAKDILQKNDFVDIHEKETLQPGDKVFSINRDRSLYIAVIGEERIENGLKIVAAHGDSPRIDLKQNPLYEEKELALLKTHYYGGIKEYQWPNIPLSIHGRIVKTNGETIDICIGEKAEEPIFTISDLLIHLAEEEQMQRKLKEGVRGEELNVLVGSIPCADATIEERVKENVLKLLYEKYGITEMDFMSAEIELVPAWKARSLGFDESMIAGYAQDDKVCCYTALRGILNVTHPKNTAVCVIIDKEEIGFVGVTGMYSKIFDTFIANLLDKRKQNQPNALEKTFSHSMAISADVESAYNPSFSSNFEPYNTAYLGKGLTVVKYGGGEGKANSSEAPAEVVAELRRIYDEAGVKYQACELGKVDKGGGGTIALTLANRGMDVIDSGVPIMGMHAPYEITSKFDVYQAYKGYEAFYQS